MEDETPITPEALPDGQGWKRGVYIYDRTVTEEKLTQELQDEINSGYNPGEVNSEQVTDDNVRAGYEATDGTAKDQFDGIAAKIANLDTQLTGVDENCGCIPDASLTVLPRVYNFGNVEVDTESQTVSFTVTGISLVSPITYNEELPFIIEKGSDWNDLTGGTLNVTYSPTEVEVNTLVLALTSTSLNGQNTVAEAILVLSGEGTASWKGAFKCTVGVPAGDSLMLPILPTDGDIQVDWGDGYVQRVGYNYPSHGYTVGDYHQIRIVGKFDWNPPSTYPQGYKNRFLTIDDWGDEAYGRFGCYDGNYYEPYNSFCAFWNLESIPTDSTGFRWSYLGSLFRDCYTLKSVPQDLYTGKQVGGNTDSLSINSIYARCTSLKSIPAGQFEGLPPITNSAYAYSGTTFTDVPLNLVPKTIRNCSNLFADTRFSTLQDAYFKDYVNCTTFEACFTGAQLLQLPDNCFEGCTAAESFADLFLNNVGTFRGFGTDCFKGCVNVKTIYRMCRNCSLNNNIPEGIFDDMINLEDVGHVFWSNSLLRSVPLYLFAKNKKIKSSTYLFSACGALTSETPKNEDGSPMWERSSANGYEPITNFSRTFNSATLMADYDSIPSTWK